MDDERLRELFAAGAVGHLATVRPDGAPHVVPVVLAVRGERVFTAVDAKPKRTHRLQRLADLRHEPRCAVLVDHYESDWSRLWWVRADGNGTVVEEPPPDHPGLVALRERHPQYATQPPTGPLVVITVRRWSGWSSAG